MNTIDAPQPGSSAAPSCSAHLLPLDLAMIRWSVRCRTWQEMSAGSQPELGPFLAGWFCRCIGAGLVVDGHFRDSFRIGWKEADDHIAIEIQKGGQQHAKLDAARNTLAYIRDKAESLSVTRLHIKDIAVTGLNKSGGPLRYYACPSCTREFVQPPEGYAGMCPSCQAEALDPFGDSQNSVLSEPSS